MIFLFPHDLFPVSSTLDSTWPSGQNTLSSTFHLNPPASSWHCLSSAHSLDQLLGQIHSCAGLASDIEATV